VAAASSAAAEARQRVVDFRPFWDEATPLANPHKGWYHHYFDNGVDKYLPKDDVELSGFPGMDHIYLRLAWSYLEPEEGRFNWPVVDAPIEKWTAKGMGVAFRISCKETGTNRAEQQFATPRWVRDAGAKGGHYSKGVAAGPEAPWEPVYDDPVFLAKLDAFLQAFAGRYDGQPWLRYVDVGSVGDWGEGHTSSGSRLKYGYAAMARHVEMHARHFRKTPLVISDDYVTSLSEPQERSRLRELIRTLGISYRDDSILVDWYVTTYSKTWTVRSPELFEDVWQKVPTVFELEHYGSVKGKGNWVPRPGSSLARFGGGKTGADFFKGALELLHATYIGYHGYAGEWQADNPALTGELLNRCGYWFFPLSASVPERLVAGRPNAVSIEWLNRGVAPAYHAYTLVLRLRGPGSYESEQPANNQRWLPSGAAAAWPEAYQLSPPASLPVGTYALAMKLRSPEAGRDVALPLKEGRRDADGFYLVGEVQLAR
jgi:hypothetical protein